MEPIRVLSRAISILRTIDHAGVAGMRLTAITRETDLSKTTAIRLIQTLMHEGMLDRDEDGRYFLGPGARLLGVADRDEAVASLKDCAAAPVRRIAIAAGDSAFLSVRHHFHAVCHIREDGSYPLKTHVLQPGTRLPLGVGAGGIAMLAALDEQEIARCVDANRRECEQRYPNSLPPGLFAQLRECREKGYAINRGSVVRESWALGAVIRDPRGVPVAALTLAAISSRLQPAREAELGPWLADEAAALEKTYRSLI